ncbi:hypothetical protein TNCV_282491 [Trichonephila clavipes]|nr:hypothetical protein TNCV_282491 [Trichonephila clavipes]
MCGVPFKTESITGESPTFTEEDTTMPYSGFEFELIRLQAEVHIHHTGWKEICYTTRGLLATDHVYKSEPWLSDMTTPELTPPSPNYHTTPTGGRFSSRQI